MHFIPHKAPRPCPGLFLFFVSFDTNHKTNKQEDIIKQTGSTLSHLRLHLDQGRGEVAGIAETAHLSPQSLKIALVVSGLSIG